MLAPAPSSRWLIVLLLMMKRMHSFAPSQVEDAARLRLRISECFERAALPQTTPEVHLGACCWPGACCACCACSLVRRRQNGSAALPQTAPKEGGVAAAGVHAALAALWPLTPRAPLLLLVLTTQQRRGLVLLPAGAQEAAVLCDCGRRPHGRGGGGGAA